MLLIIVHHAEHVPSIERGKTVNPMVTVTFQSLIESYPLEIVDLLNRYGEKNQLATINVQSKMGRGTVIYSLDIFLLNGSCRHWSFF